MNEITQGTSLAVQGLNLCLPMQGIWVLFLVRQLRSHMPHWPKNQNTDQKQYCNKLNKDFKKTLSVAEPVLPSRVPHTMTHISVMSEVTPDFLCWRTVVIYQLVSNEDSLLPPAWTFSNTYIQAHIFRVNKVITRVWKTF